MKEPINVFDYATRIEKNLPGGALLNTLHTRFDSMVIGWGHLGTLWSKPTFIVYVRDSRFTKEQLDATGEFRNDLFFRGSLRNRLQEGLGHLKNRSDLTHRQRDA